jgi:hypothetical protein
VVSGIEVVHYTYEYEDNTRQDVVVPIGRYTIILGVGSEKYSKDFDRILSTFRLIGKSAK